MKKYILLLIFLVILTGCDVKYELNFQDENLIENIQLTLKNNEKDKIDELKRTRPYAIFNWSNERLYNVNYDPGILNFIANYSYTYNIDEFKQAKNIGDCFDAYSFVKQNDNYILSTSKGFNCMTYSYVPINNLIIEITTNHEVLENNADETKNNKYIWNITNDNTSDKQIYIKFGKVKQQSFFEQLINFLMKNKITIIFLSLLFVILIFCCSVIIIISKKNNEID